MPVTKLLSKRRRCLRNPSRSSLAPSSQASSNNSKTLCGGFGSEHTIERQQHNRADQRQHESGSIARMPPACEASDDDGQDSATYTDTWGQPEAIGTFARHQRSRGQPCDPSNGHQQDHPQHLRSSLNPRSHPDRGAARRSFGLQVHRAKARCFHLKIKSPPGPYFAAASWRPCRYRSTLTLSTSDTPVSTNRGKGENESVEESFLKS